MCDITLTKTCTVTKNEDDALIINHKDSKDTLNFRINHRYQRYDIDLDRESVKAIYKFLEEYLQATGKSIFNKDVTTPVVEFKKAS